MPNKPFLNCFLSSHHILELPVQICFSFFVLTGRATTLCLFVRPSTTVLAPAQLVWCNSWRRHRSHLCLAHHLRACLIHTLTPWWQQITLKIEKGFSLYNMKLWTEFA